MNQVKTLKAGTALFLLVFSFFNVYIYMLQKGLLTSRFDYCILFADVVILTILLCFLVNMINKAARRQKYPLSKQNKRRQTVNTQFLSGSCKWQPGFRFFLHIIPDCLTMTFSVRFLRRWEATVRTIP